MITLKPEAVPVRPTALLRVGPIGSLERSPRDYLIALEITLGRGESVEEELTRIGALAASSLRGVSPKGTASDGPVVRNLRSASFRGKDGAMHSSIWAVEAEVLCAGWPADDAIAAIRNELSAAGYLVTTEERRACAEVGCNEDAPVKSSRRDVRPQGWFNESVCGRHNFRACTSCHTVFRLVSESANGPAPSLHCSHCGVVMIEWGGTKVWEAQLVTKAAAMS